MDRNHPILGFFHEWVREFSAEAERVEVIVLEAGQYDLPAHVTVRSLGKERGSSKAGQLVRFWWYFGHAFFIVRPTHVFFHMGAIMNVLAAPFWFLSFITRTRFYWWKAHGHINVFGRFASLFVDRIYTSTESGFPIKTKKRYVIGQAIDPNYFTPNESVRVPKRVLFAGRISPTKKIEEFIATARLLEPVGYSFVIIGPVCDEVYEATLKELAAGTNIEFAGAKSPDELRRYYQEADIFLNPSQTNSMDKTVLEAALSGALPVTSNIAFIALLQQYGLYVSDPSGERFAEVIRDIDVSNTVRNAIRSEIIATHSLDTFAERVFGDKK